MVLAAVVAMVINLVVVVASNHVMTVVVIVVIAAVMTIVAVAVVIVLALAVTTMKAAAIVIQRRVKRMATQVHTRTVLQGLNLIVKDQLVTVHVTLVTAAMTAMAIAVMPIETAAPHLTVALVTVLHLVKNHFRVMIKTAAQTVAAAVVKVIVQMQPVATLTVY